MPGRGRQRRARGARASRSLAGADVALGLLLTGSSAALLKVLSPRAGTEDWWFVVLLGLPLIVRRSFPRTSAAIVGTAALVQALVGSPVGFHDAAVLVSLATLTGWTPRRTGLLGLVAAGLLVVVGSATDWWSYLDLRLGPGPRTVHVLTTAGALVLVLAAWAYGEQTRRARAGAAAVRERAVRAERERDQQAALAAAAERTRIAREMHDVVAHGLSVMVVQAEGARYALPESAATSREALAEVARTGRTALGEMRQLLGLLRAEPYPGPPTEPSSVDPSRAEEPQPPAPGLDQLDDLVAQARAAGAEVSVRRRGDLGRIAPVVALTVYRVVQEGLTNARRHGGHRVQVDLDADGDELLVRVHDDGRPGAALLPTVRGHGLVGVGERAAAAGGRASAGPAVDGGFTMQVALPLAAEDR